MLERLSETPQNTLAVRAIGKLTDRDYRELLIPQLESIIREHGKARLLLDMGDDYHGWTAAAMWDDFRLGMAHRKDFEKMGIVGAPPWATWVLKLGALIIRGEIRSFPSSRREEARAWIRA